jgi:hypothetical protein
MRIADLDYLEAAEATCLTGAGSGHAKGLKQAGVSVQVLAAADGEFTRTRTFTRTTIRELPRGGTIAIGVGVGVAIAFTPPSN